MREILFKAKELDSQEWVVGSLVKLSEYDYRIASESDVRWAYTGYGDYDGTMTKIDSNTICQFTGLLDKNGNKIWENDVVTVLERGIEMSGGFIAFFNDYPGGWLITNKTMEARCCLCMRNNVEVIGNIFDNAELLKE